MPFVIIVIPSYSVDYQTLPTRLEIVDVEKKKGLSKYYVSSPANLQEEAPSSSSVGVRHTSDVSRWLPVRHRSSLQTV